MKTKLLACALLIFASAAALSTAEPTTERPVVDLDGNQLRFGVPYFAIPAIKIWAGVGLPAEKPKEPCGKEVILTEEKGIPLVFTNANPNATGDISVASEVLISFDEKEHCGVSTAWKTGEDFSVTIGGKEANRTAVFRITSAWFGPSYLLSPISPLLIPMVVGVEQYTSRLVVEFQISKISLSFYFKEVKKDESRETVIKMPQSM